MSNCKKKFIVKTNSTISKGDKGDKGDKGEPGDPSLLFPISSDNITYQSLTLTQVLDNILYVPLVINSFIASPSIYEKGQSLTSISLSWSFNKTIQSQSIVGTGLTPPSLLPGARSVVAVLTSLTSNTTLTLTSDDNLIDVRPAKTATVDLKFLNKIYWGHAVTPGSINSAFVLGLSSSNLQAARQASFTVNVGTSEYIWVAIPVAYAAASFKTNGFAGGLSLQATISFTNASGWTESYNIYRSDNISLGSTVVDIL